MIRSIRSALACKSVVEAADGGSDYLGILGEELVAETRPGYVEVCIALHLGLDRRKTRGLIRIHAADFEHTVPYEVLAGWSVAQVVLPVKAPVIAEGPLIADIYDEAKQAKPFRAMWTLIFAADARVLDPPAAAAFTASVRRARPPSAAGTTRSKTRH